MSRPRGVRRVAAGLLPLLLTLGALPAAAAVPPDEAPRPAPAAALGAFAVDAADAAVEADEAGLQVTGVVPAELRPGGTVTVSGLVQGGPSGLTDASVTVRVARNRSTSMSSLQRWTAAVDTRPGPAAALSPFEDPAPRARTALTREVGDVGAGAAVPFSLSLSADELDLGSSTEAAGPYGLQLELGTPGEVVDDERGFLVYSPPVDVTPTPLLTTLTLAGPEVEAATGLPDLAALREQTAPGGRLDRLLEAAGRLDADWLVQPTLLAGLRAAAADPPDGTSDDLPDSTTDGTTGSTDGTTDGSTDGGTGAATDDGTGDAADDGAGTPPGEDAPAPPGSTGGPAVPADPPPGSDAPAGPVDAPAGSDPPAPAPGGTTPGGAAPEPSDGGSGAGSGTDPAGSPARWLERLAQARGDRDVVLSDWARPDPDRIRSAEDPEQAWQVLGTARQDALPDATVQELLGPTRTDVLVVGGDEGPTTQQDLATLARDRDRVLLPEADVPLLDPFALTYTPQAVTSLDLDGTTATGVLGDTTLTADAVDALAGEPLSVTRVLARLAVTTLQRPSDPRLLAVTLPADLSPTPDGAETLARALARTQWATPVALSDAFDLSPSDAPREDLPTIPGPSVVAGVEPMLRAVEDFRDVASALQDSDDPALRTVLDRRVAAALSQDVAPDVPGRLEVELRQQRADTVAGVRVVPGSQVTLAAAEASLPVTVVNDLPVGVELVLQVRSRSPRLQVPQQQSPVTVAAGERAVVTVPVVAVASGRAEVVSQLVTADGQVWGEPSRVVVTVATQAEGRVLAAVGVVVGLVFVGGAVRALLRNRRRRELEQAGTMDL